MTSFHLRTVYGFALFFASIFMVSPVFSQTEPEEHAEVSAPGISTAMRMADFAIDRYEQGKILTFRWRNEKNLEIYRALIGVSEAQQAMIDSKFGEAEEKFEELREKEEKLNDWKNMSPEELAKAEDEFFASFSTCLDEADNIILESLTPAQVEKMREVDLILPIALNTPNGDVDVLVNFESYDVLELSEEQKEKIAAIRKETDEEKKRILSEAKELMEKAFNSPKDANSLQTQMKAMELLGKATRYSADTKSKLRNILTPEQRERFDTIKKDVSKKLAAIRAEIKKKQKEQDDAWKKSWKPGDPLPEGAVPPSRPGRFPFKRSTP